MSRMILYSILIWSSQALALNGQSDDIYALVRIDTDVVKSWLPDRLELVPEGDTHPVIMNFGKQRGVGPLPPYLELTVKVPMVKFRDGSDSTYSFYKVLYMNNNQAVLWGIALYDSPKKFAPMTMSDDTVEVFDEDSGNLIFRAQFEGGSIAPMSPSHPNYEDILRYTTAERVTYMRNRYKCWQVTGTTSSIKPLGVHVDIFDGFIEDLAPLSQQIQGLDVERLGAFRSQSRWRFRGMNCR